MEDAPVQPYGSQGSRSTLSLKPEAGEQTYHNQRDAPINIRVTIPKTFPGPSPNVQPLATLSGSAVTVTLAPPIRLDTNKKWELVPYILSVPYTTPNLGPTSANIPGFPAGNSRFTFSIGSGATADFVLPAGLYDVNDIAQQMNIFAEGAGWITDAFTSPIFAVAGIAATQQSVITVDPANLVANAGGSGNAQGAWPVGGVTITLTNPSPDTGLNDSIGQMLGFPVTGGSSVLNFFSADTTAAGTGAPVAEISPNRADLARLTAIVIFSDIVTGSYVDGVSSNAFYTVPVTNAVPNSIITVQPSFPQSVPIGQYLISSFRIWFTDQIKNYLPAFNEDCQVSFSIQEVAV